VHNESGGPIDVYVLTGDDYAGRPLGTAPPGITELGLPQLDPQAKVSFRAARPGGQTIARAFGGRAAYNRISYDVVCRP
jgi:hypothetical protein